MGFVQNLLFINESSVPYAQFLRNILHLKMKLHKCEFYCQYKNKFTTGLKEKIQKIADVEKIRTVFELQEENRRSIKTHFQLNSSVFVPTFS